MASATPPPPHSTFTRGLQSTRKPLGLFTNAKKRKHSFVQFFAMTGILLLSVRSLGQKYRINDLQEDMAGLKEEGDGLSKRMDRIKQSLLAEAAADRTGLFASRLRLLFAKDKKD